ncbi:MAG: thioredoxin domain-containing protein, partial [Vicinamibacterales bacterium]
AKAGHYEQTREVAGPDGIAIGVEQFRRVYDGRRGGFGDAPKFPRPSELLFLLRAGATNMVLDTLRAMALGGMRDHLGGGFHRYSVDGAWRVPHFEKMLYDQAQLALAYLEAAQASHQGIMTSGASDAAFYATVAEDTLDYVLRDMTDDGGGFYSAEDADSVPPESANQPEAHKTEGAFYLWRDDEVEALLGDDAEIVRKRFGIEAGGNAPHDPQQEFTGKNILYVDQPIEDIAIRTARPAEEVMDVLARARRAMFDARSTRPRPHLDDKILTAWNGLMIAALARAARVLSGPGPLGPRDRYLDAARRAARFIKETLWRGGRGPERPALLRRYRAGEAAIDGYCEDYACLVWGLIELFQADGDPAWLEWAVALQEAQDARFWDEADAGWFSTTGGDPSVLLRLKEEYDGAEPAPGSVATLNSILLAHLTGRREFTERAERTLARYGPRLGEAARALPFMMAALATWHAGIEQIVVVGQSGAPDTEAMRAAVARRYRPFAVVIPVEPGERQKALAGLLPFIGPMTMRDGRATTYVCREFTCQEPVTDPAAFGA